MNSLNEVLEEQLRDLYATESQILKVLPRMVKRARSDDLRFTLQEHLEDTEKHIERLDNIGKRLHMTLSGKDCKAIEGLLEESKHVLAEENAIDIKDVALITAAQRIGNFEICVYGTVIALANSLGHHEEAAILEQTLGEECSCDQELSFLASKELKSSKSAGTEHLITS